MGPSILVSLCWFLSSAALSSSALAALSDALVALPVPLGQAFVSSQEAEFEPKRCRIHSRRCPDISFGLLDGPVWNGAMVSFP